jgi:hypothetical protein
MNRLLPLAAVAALFAVACDPAPEASEPADYAWVLPGDEILVDMPEARRSAGDDSELRAQSMQTALDVNTFISDVLTQIDAITDFQPTWADETETKVLWGPWTDDGVDGALYVEALEDGSYEWALIAKPEGSGEEAWVALIGGAVEPGATETTGKGAFAVDFDAITSIATDGTDATGIFASTYDVRENSVDAQAAFEGFAEHAGDPVVDAAYRYGNDKTGGYMDLAYEADVTESGAEETVILRSRWVKGGAGRGDAYLTGGDFGPLVYQASECWNESGIIVFDENNAELTTSGNVDDCVFTEAQWNDDGV